jgi:hypothetical protein
MADEKVPEDSGTTDEQFENDGLAVEAVDEAEQEQEQEDEMDMAEQMQEAVEMLEALSEDPENVAALGIVVNTKNGIPEELADDVEDPTGGMTWRIVNPDLEGYENVRSVVRTFAAFNAGLEEAEVPMERSSGPGGLGAMLGLE